MKIKGILFNAFLLTVGSFSLLGEAFAATLPNDRPLNVMILGDSVTRGVMADAKMGHPNPHFYADMVRGQLVVGFYSLVGKIFGTPDPTEDDIDFIEKNFSHMSRLSLSAFVGSQFYSLPLRIERATSYRPNVYNGAILAAGFRTADIALTRFERLQRKTPNKVDPDVVVVNYNGMDFVNNVKLETFKKDVSRFFIRLRKIAPAAVVFVTEMSDPIPMLTGPDQIAVPPNFLMPKGLTCHALYRQLQFGGRSNLSPDSTPEQIAAASDRLAEMRSILADQIDYTNRADASGQVVLINNIFGNDAVDPLKYLAADCIHPNMAGQKLIGDTMWDTISDYLY